MSSVPVRRDMKYMNDRGRGMRRKRAEGAIVASFWIHASVDNGDDRSYPYNPRNKSQRIGNEARHDA